ncbi:MAG: radical SAM protein, partial [bacterium]|nr:radical SAM protein [bacterium]
EPPSVSKFGCQRIMGGFGVNKIDFAWPPLDLMMISGCLEKYGFPASIFDFNNTKLTFKEVRQSIIREKPRMIVFSTSSTTIYNDLKVADIAKEISQDILTVAIGVHVMALPEEILGYTKNLDIAVYSEPEWVIMNLVKNNYNPANTLGLCYRNGNQIKRNEPQPDIHDLEKLGFPSHDKINMRIYHDPLARRRPLTYIMAQRGCTGNCTFCCQPYFWSEKQHIMRRRSVPHVIQELKWIQKLGYKEVFWNDTRLTPDIEWSNQLMDQIIANKIDLTWSTCDHAASGIGHKETGMALLKKMKKAGCHTIRLGLESADPQILKNTGKGTTPDEVKRVAENIKKAGMEVLLHTIFGLPGETKETMEETVKFIKSLDVDYVTLGIAQPYPGTPFWNYLVQNNYLKTRDWSKYDSVEPPVYEYPNLSSEEIFKAHYRGLREFYLRPSYIIKRFLKIRSIYDIKKNFNSFRGFLSRYVFPNNEQK